jgi:hypothetical protein
MIECAGLRILIKREEKAVQFQLGRSRVLMREPEPVRALLFLDKTSRFDTGAVCSHRDSIFTGTPRVFPSQSSYNSIAV